MGKWEKRNFRQLHGVKWACVHWRFFLFVFVFVFLIYIYWIKEFTGVNIKIARKIQSCTMNIVLHYTKHKQKLRSELKRSQLKTFIYLRPLYVKSMQSTITCAYVFFCVQMTFKYYIPFQVHLSMYVWFSKKNDITNIFIKPVVIRYSKHYEFVT